MLFIRIRTGFFRRALLDGKYTIHSVGIQGICAKAVKALGGENHNPTVRNTTSGPFDDRHVRRIEIDMEYGPGPYRMLHLHPRSKSFRFFIDRRCHLGFETVKLPGDFGVGGGEDLGRQDGCVPGTGLADGHCCHRNAGWHLNG